MTTLRNVTNGDGAWRNVVIAALLSALISVASAWIAFGQDTVRRSELDGLKAVVTQLSESVNRLETTVAVLSERVCVVGQAKVRGC
jgi:hypothetical protein